MITPDQIESAFVVPEHDKSTPVKVKEARFIYDFIKAHKIKDTLEVGLGYGRSASYIMMATGTPHTAIDPFQEHYQNQALKNIEAAGLAGQFTHINDFSHFTLPDLCRKNATYDFIFIDGDHKFDGILVDFYYASMLCRKGGYLLLHDTWMRSTELVSAFVKTNRKDFIKVKTPIPNFCLFQKVDEKDARDGMHFKEFINLNGIMKYRLINYLYNRKKRSS